MNTDYRLNASPSVDARSIVVPDALVEKAPQTPAAVQADVIPLTSLGQEKGGEGGKEGHTTPPSPPLPPSSKAARTDASPARVAPPGDDVLTPAPATNPVVAASKQAGIYLGQRHPGQHEITCPWSHEHADTEQRAAVYQEPTMLTPLGTFTCPHSHKEYVAIDRLLDRLGVDPLQARCKPRIRVVSGEMLRINHAAEQALSSLGGYYQSGGAIVTINRTNNGDVVVSAVNDNILTKALAQAADWEKYNGQTKGWSPCDPTPQLVKLLLNAQEHDHLPVLDGVARQPYFRKVDGKLICEPGYDRESRIYAAFDRETFTVGETSEHAARAALGELKSLVSEFQFATEADRSATIGGMLTAAIRSALPVAPAFNITASTPGTGKSYLGTLLAAFSGPGEPLNLSYPTTTDEASKGMLAALLTKPAVISFDDMQTDWLPFGMMNRMLTSETVADRMLGVSRVIQVGTNTFVMGTGNNVSPTRDMCRRVVTITLRALTSSPTTHRYSGRPVEKVKEARARFVSLALSIVQAWISAGRPRTDVPDIATFGVWSDMVRQPLLWLGESDPAASLIEQVNTDPDAESLSRLMTAWRFAFGSKPVTLRKLIERAETEKSALQDALLELPMTEKGYINRSRLGWYLKRNANRIAAGMYLQKDISSERNAWSVQLIDPSGEHQSAHVSNDNTTSVIERAWISDSNGCAPGEKY